MDTKFSSPNDPPPVEGVENVRFFFWSSTLSSLNVELMTIFPSPSLSLLLPEREVQATLLSARRLVRLSCWMFLTVRQSQGQEFSPTLSRASLGRELSDQTGKSHSWLWSRDKT